MFRCGSVGCRSFHRDIRCEHVRREWWVFVLRMCDIRCEHVRREWRVFVLRMCDIRCEHVCREWRVFVIRMCDRQTEPCDVFIVMIIRLHDLFLSLYIFMFTGLWILLC